MDKEDLKKLLAGMSIAGLLAGTTVTVGCASAGRSSCTGDKPGAASTEMMEKEAGDGNMPGAGSTEMMEKESGAGGSGSCEGK